MSENQASCEACGQTLGLLAEAETLCATCLLASTLEKITAEGSGHAGDLSLAAPCVDQLNQQAHGLEFIELLGAGGAGWVYLAKQASLDRLVAVKLLKRRSGLETHERRFTDEAKTLARLSHPRLVTVYDHGLLDHPLDEPLQYLVMEFVGGPTLRQWLRSGPMPIGEALRVAKQLGEAIAYAHAQGVVHRDLKPENVLFESDEQGAGVKVADFGISKLVHPTVTAASLPTSYTATGFVLGTPYYMAPESHYQATDASPQADIYSLGVMLYEMLTGRLPLGVFPAPVDCSDAPPAVSRAVLRALSANPEERFASVEDFSEALAGRAPTTSKSPTARLSVGIGAALLTLLGVVVMQASIPAGPEADSAESALMESEQPTVPPTAAEAPPAPEAEPAPVAEGPQVEITKFAVRGQRPFNRTLEFELKLLRPADLQRDGATLHWVYRGPRGQRIAGQLPDLNGRREALISEPIHTTSGSLWPAELYIEERWGDPTSPARRRVSEVFQVQGWHVNGVPGF